MRVDIDSFLRITSLNRGVANSIAKKKKRCLQKDGTRNINIQKYCYIKTQKHQCL